MKKFTLIIASLFLTCAAMAQSSEKGLTLKNVSVVRSGEEVVVSFDVEAGRKAVSGDMTLVYAPVITDGQYRVSLPAVMVQGRRGAASWERREWVSGNEAAYGEGVLKLKNKQRSAYSASVPFQPWMEGAVLEAETVVAGCCSRQAGMLILAENIIPAPAAVKAPVIEVVPEPVPAEVNYTIAETLAHTFPFVLPVSEFDPNEPIKFYDDERDNSLIVYYRINNYDIEPEYADNYQTLVNLTAAINIILRSDDSNVERVVVAGFASPEGPFEVNDRLAWERAVSVKEYIIKQTGVPDGMITLFNGSADWRGLRLLVERETTMQGRREVLDIIDNYPVWDHYSQTGRMTLIRRLNNGRTYEYMARHIFPKLRNGAFIRVYFNNNDN